MEIARNISASTINKSAPQITSVIAVYSNAHLFFNFPASICCKPPSWLSNGHPD